MYNGLPANTVGSVQAAQRLPVPHDEMANSVTFTLNNTPLMVKQKVEVLMLCCFSQHTAA